MGATKVQRDVCPTCARPWSDDDVSAGGKAKDFVNAALNGLQFGEIVITLKVQDGRCVQMLKSVQESEKITGG